MKHSYHTDLAVQFQLGLLNKDIYKNIPKSTLYSWKNKDFSRVVGSDIIFSDEKMELIKTFLSNQTLLKAAKGLFFIYFHFQDEHYKDAPLAAVYYEMMRKGRAFMSLTAFYKYAKFFDNTSGRKRFKDKQKTGIRAATPKEIIHADVCVYRPMDYTKTFIYFIVDNFSRMILGWKISNEYKSSIMLDNLRNVYSKYFLENQNPATILLVDDGIENKGLVCEAIENEEINITRYVAQKDIIFSNSMVEAVNKQMKYNFLFRHQLFDIEHTQRFLETAVEQYNNRPHSALYGFTPIEVFNGAKPDKYFFKPQMEEAKMLRKAENKMLSCDSCAFLLEKNE